MHAEFFCREISVYFRNCPEVRAASIYKQLFSTAPANDRFVMPAILPSVCYRTYTLTVEAA